MKKSKIDTTERSSRDNLDARYGAIGISAVAAAVRYQGDRPKGAEDMTETRPKPKSDLAA
jgi:hypothetical protein